MIGQRCLPSCTKDADCSSLHGPRGAHYTCDPIWGACVIPRLAAPKLATCNKPAPPSGPFGSVVQVTDATAPGRYQFEPTAAALPNGDVVIAFSIGVALGKAYTAATTVVHPDGSVDAPQLLRGRDSSIDVWMAKVPSGVAVVWLTFDGAMAPEKNPGIAFATSADGKTWSPTRYAHDPKDCPSGEVGCFDKPMLTVGPKGELYVFYETDNAGMRVVRSQDGGATFSAATSVGDLDYGSVVVDRTGAIHLAAGDGGHHVFYARSDDHGATFNVRPVTGDGEAVPMFYSNPQVLSDPNHGVVYVVYPHGGPDGQWDVILASSKDRGATWTKVKVNDDAACANHAAPMAVLDPATSEVQVTWIENRTGSGALVHARCAVLGATCTPNDTVSSTPFASYALVRHSPKWMGEYGALLGSSHSLTAVWTQPVPDANGFPTSRIFLAKTKHPHP
jgi:hypothetical protein